MSYADLTARNYGYITPEAQARIRATRLLIAGCGMGSVFAETAVRMGYEQLTLADHDTVEAHNLNRQDFTAADIGMPKVESLKKRLLAINPEARIEALCEKVTPQNAPDIVAKTDLVFDTIDFLDLPGLVALHDACHAQDKPLVTAVSAGFGAVCLYFPERKQCTIRDLFGLPTEGSVQGISYSERYSVFIEKIARRLDPAVVKHFFEINELLSQGQPCPASQVAPGASAVALLAGAIGARIAAGIPVPEAPDMLMINVADLMNAPVPAA